MMYYVEDIRNGVSQVEDKTGLYKWWCTREVLYYIANELDCNIENCSIEEIETEEIETENNETLFCVYVGVAVKETLKERIKWHMGNHTDSSVKHKTLSTLKQSLSAILYHDMSPSLKGNLDDYMDQFYVSVNTDISEAQDIYAEEKRLLSEKGQPLYILNIQGNKHEQSPKQKLKDLRKVARNKAMEQI